MPLSQTKSAIAMREYRERMKKEKGEKATAVDIASLSMKAKRMEETK